MGDLPTIPTTASTRPADAGLRALTDLVIESEGWASLRAALAAGQSGTIDGAWGSSAALAAAAMASDSPGTLLVVVPNVADVEPWAYDRQLYRRRNEVERLFRRLKGFRRIFSRFEKLDLMFKAFIHFALIADMLCVNTPQFRGAYSEGGSGAFSACTRQILGTVGR